MNLVWFKRDLRTEDHQALARALQDGPVIPLYILEPRLWLEPDLSARHFNFLVESLVDLNRSLGNRLVIRVGEAVDVLEQLYTEQRFDQLWSHQETWNGWSYSRDKKVSDWLKEKSIDWHQPAQNGVVRSLVDRDGWSKLWYAEMKKPMWSIKDNARFVKLASDLIPTPEELQIREDSCSARQIGGRSEGLKLLDSFIHERGESYNRGISSPITAVDSCSRLSAHLAFGTVSVREVFQATEQRKLELKNGRSAVKDNWGKALRAFSGRLRWHCHFIQKLEDEPTIEFNNMHPAYDGLRESDFNSTYFDAWCRGETGYPMVDACMRALISTGWINFRMRAMLVSFASYHLWLHWRETALYLARLFTDYEPGIHYSQVQMQSGTTGINSIRIYNPIKQGIDQDPDGQFIRTWIPELRKMSTEFIHTPWKDPANMNGYPMPIVDEKDARTSASSKIYALRKTPEHKERAAQVVKKHGSRKSSSSRRKPPKTALAEKQRELPF